MFSTSFTRRSSNLKVLAAVSAVAITSIASAATIPIDGTINPAFGTPSASIAYDPAAPNGNFGDPTLTTNNVSYDIYTADDGTNFDVALTTTGDIGVEGETGEFANLYIDTVAGTANGNHSQLGISVGNGSDPVAFIPGGQGTTDITGDIQEAFKQDIVDGSVVGDTIEVGIPNTFLENDPANIGFPTTAFGGDVSLRLSQTFGYSVAGYDGGSPLNLGEAAVPEPTMGCGLMIAGMFLFSRRPSRIRA